MRSTQHLTKIRTIYCLCAQPMPSLVKHWPLVWILCFLLTPWTIKKQVEQILLYGSDNPDHLTNHLLFDISMSSYILVADFRTNFKPSSPELTSTVESRYNAVAGVQKAGRVISGSRYGGTTVLPMMVDTLGLYGHAIHGSGRCYVLDITGWALLPPINALEQFDWRETIINTDQKIYVSFLN